MRAEMESLAVGSRDETIERAKSDMQAWAKEIQRLVQVSENAAFIPQPRGIWRKRCPTCAKRLRKTSHYAAISGFGHRLTNYKCDCGYEIAFDCLDI